MTYRKTDLLPKSIIASKAKFIGVTLTKCGQFPSLFFNFSVVDNFLDIEPMNTTHNKDNNTQDFLDCRD